MLNLLLKLLYYYCLFSYYISIFLVIVGILFGTKVGYSNAKSLILINFNRFNMSYYDCIIEYVCSVIKYSVMYCSLLLLLEIILPFVFMMIVIKKIFFYKKLNIFFLIFII